MALYLCILGLALLAEFRSMSIASPVSDTPVVVIHPKDETVRVGYNVTLNCTWNKPANNCYWMKNDKRISMSQRYSIPRASVEDCSLVITGVQPVDEGSWRCVFSKVINTSTLNIKLKLNFDEFDFSQAMMAFDVQPQDTEVNSGDDVVLHCQFSKPAPQCFWSKDSDIMILEGRYQFADDPKTGNCSLRIANVNFFDFGKYKCGFPRTEVRPPLNSRTANLTVKVTPSGPFIAVGNLQVKNDDNVYISLLESKPRISCWAINGYPAAELQWFLNNTQLTSARQLHLSKNRGLLISELPLLMHIPSSWQQLELTCKATHPTFGDDEVHATSVTLILGTASNNTQSHYLTTYRPYTTTKSCTGPYCRYG